MQEKWKGVYLEPLREREEYQPEEEEVMQYAESIGIVVQQEMHLIYLAYQGYQQKLPLNWQACRAPNDQIIYRNFVTGQIMEQHPLEEIYRQKVRQARIQGDRDNNQSQETVVQEALSQIAEDENELGNDSEIYNRGRYHIDLKKDMLRQPITNSGTKQLNQIRDKERLSKITFNSALDRNISEKQEIQSQKQANFNASNNILPSSLMGQSIRTYNQLGLEKYRTVMTQKNDWRPQQSPKNSLSSELKNEKKVAQLRKQLQQITKQQKLKMDLLQQFKKINSKKALKIKNKLRLKNKQR